MENHRKKLLFVITQFFKGGAELSLLDLLNQLSPREFDIDFLVLNQVEVDGAISLVSKIPKWVRVLDLVAVEKEKGKAMTWNSQSEFCRGAAKALLENDRYHWAFHVGEWSSPRFVAQEVNAEYKACWIHQDLDKAEYFDKQEFLRYTDFYSYYIFVCQRSMNASLSIFPMLAQKAIVIHNVADKFRIKKLSAVALEKKDAELFIKPTIVTCANVRVQKNHVRQVQAMAELKKRGINFTWINVGSIADKIIVENVRREIKKYKLEESFLLLGAKENPYPYMANAKALAVLSDQESWSIVIMEALALSVPVIATPTSGALHQIQSGVNGLLTEDFTVLEIADTIEKFLLDTDLQNSIISNINQKSAKQKGLEEFITFVNAEHVKAKQSVLYLLDNVNYKGGARQATVSQIKSISDDFDITLLSGIKPEDQAYGLFENVKIASFPSAYYKRPYLTESTKHVLRGNYTISQKLVKMFFYALKLMKMNERAVQSLQSKDIHPFLETYDNIVVVSEASIYRDMVSKLSRPKKIQWIHTDYKRWRQYNDWTRSVTAEDGKLYSRYDNIVCVSEYCRQGFIDEHPNLEQKTLTIYNVVQDSSIMQRAKAKNHIRVDKKVPSLITLARLCDEKNHMGLLEIARKLKQLGLEFKWYFVGDGELRKSIEDAIIEMSLEDYIMIVGHLDNPYPLLAEMDLMVLFSLYEATPVTIDEALVLGVPVASKRLGGISEQIEHGKTGILIDGDEHEGYLAIKKILAEPEKLQNMKEHLVAGAINNKYKIQKLRNLFA